MAVTNSPNMQLPIPGVGTEAGPDFAIDINASLTILDQHNHSAGSGVQINPAGININSALLFNNNLATNLAGMSLSAQATTPAVGTIYRSGDDLYYVNGVGTNIQITNTAGVVGTPGSISNLTSPASATYVSGTQTFVFQSNTNIAANLDAASVLLRNISPNSTFAVTLAAPSALASNYTLVMPAIPSSQKVMTLDASGNMAAPYSVDSSLFISANLLGIPPQGVTTSMIADGAITNAKYGTSSIDNTKIIAGTIVDGNINSGTIGADKLQTPARATVTVVGGTTQVSATWIDVPGLSVGPVTSATRRPIDIIFTGNTGVEDQSYIRVNDGSGSFRIYDTVNNRTIHQGVFGTNPATVPQFFLPASVMNTIDYFPPVGVSTYKVQVASTLGFGIVVSNVNMIAIVR